jgi:glutaminase
VDQLLVKVPDLGRTRHRVESPLEQFLSAHHDALRQENEGAVADYIPELSKADPQHFGVALATIDGHVYEVGDSGVEFTIQSISKAFVFALALDALGHPLVEARVGVEPSGEAFNSIRLNNKNQPFNAMVNAGAIACTGLIVEKEGAGAFAAILKMLSSFAARELTIDEAVYASESATGDRNRAIAWMLRNHGVIKGDVNAALDAYFRQCSVLVTARDLAVMAATLANDGVNPVTGLRVASSYSIARTLSVMTSSGMYDYAGEWTYRVGVPAKSGVGGGIIAALPAQFGLGTFSPLLDSHGNSARGLKFCEAISTHFDLHVLRRMSDVRSCIVADYEAARLGRRGRLAHDQQILESHSSAIRIIELTGVLAFANADYLARRIDAYDPPQFLILDLRRVALVSSSAVTLLASLIEALAAAGCRCVFSGRGLDFALLEALGDELVDRVGLRDFMRLDEAIDWAEDQVIFRYGGFTDAQSVGLDEQDLLAGLSTEQFGALLSLCEPKSFRPGEKILSAGDPPDSVYFLQRGMVSVKMPDGVRLATLFPGTTFGEMSLVDYGRTADVWADSAVLCQWLSLAALDQFRKRHPAAVERIMRNLALMLAKRLAQANVKVDLLSAN